MAVVDDLRSHVLDDAIELMETLGVVPPLVTAADVKTPVPRYLAPARVFAPSASSVRWSGAAPAQAGPGIRHPRSLPGRALPRAPSGGRLRHWTHVRRAGCRSARQHARECPQAPPR